MTLYPLGTIMEIVESIKEGSLPMKVTYAYEDLVFMEHNAFLLQFSASADEMLLHKNLDAEPDDMREPIETLKAAFAEKGIMINDGSMYRLEQTAQEKISIQFMKEKAIT